MVLASCLRERVNGIGDDLEKPSADYCIRLHVCEQPAHASVTDGLNKPLSSSRNFLKSESISASQCVVIKQKRDNDVSGITKSYLFMYCLSRLPRWYLVVTNFQLIQYGRGVKKLSIRRCRGTQNELLLIVR